MTDPTRVAHSTTLTPRAALTLQRRLYDLWPSLLMDALEISEQAGPIGRLEEVLALLQAAEAAVRTAVAVSAVSAKDS
jgi:hypothetical protein